MPTVFLNTLGNVIEGDQIAYRSLWCTTDVLDVLTESMMLKTTANAIVDDQLAFEHYGACLLYTSPSPRDRLVSRMPSSA